VAREGNTLRGYAAVFGVESKELWGPRGKFTERVDARAFDRTLRENPDVLLLYNHEPSQLLARRGAGTLKLAPDTRGLRFEADLPDTTLGRDVRTLLERGDLDGQMSFGFAVRKDEWRGQTRTLLDVDLVEVSVVIQAAYPQTEAALRSTQHAERVRRARELAIRSIELWTL